MGLRNHEQYEHGDMNGPGTSNGGGAPKIRYTNGVLVDPINTAAMQHALATNQTPFALLRPLNGIPVLVRVLAAGDKQVRLFIYLFIVNNSIFPFLRIRCSSRPPLKI